MKKLFLSGLIGVPIYITAQLISDTFLAGALAGITAFALDAHFVEGRRA